MIDTKLLRQKLIDMALRGQLVEQRLEDDGNATDLLEQIRAEKAALIKEGKIKKEKSLPEIKEEEKPFAIPSNWCWVHINEIANTSLGKTIDTGKNTGDYHQYLCSINVYWSGIDLTTVKKAQFEDDECIKYQLRKGDLLICEGGEAGRSAVWETDINMLYQNALHRVRFYGQISSYFYRYLMEYYRDCGILAKFSRGTTIKHLVQSSLHSIPMPLPPLAEQKRIVAKLEQINALIETMLN